MIVNEPLTGIIAIIIAYLLGSINFAYIITRLATGKDIRQLGGGNAGGRNVYRSVGIWAAVPVVFFDIAKGTSSILIAHRLLEVPIFEVNIYILLAGVAVIAGHMWSVYLKFTGGNGLAATVGALAVLIPWPLLIVIGIMLVLTIFTKNPVLSLNIGLLSLPVTSWLLEKEWLLVVFSITIIIIMILNFIPIARAALAEAGGMKFLISKLLRKTF
jgi:acyl phosphate:glycerol-3-phosphate acyltransferase